MAETGQANSFERILEESQMLVCARLAAALGGMLEKSDEALSTLASGTQNREAQALYQDARKLLAAQGTKLAEQFNKFYQTEFRNRALLAKDPSMTFSALMTSTLKLVGEDDLEETLKFKELAAKLARFCEEELAALDQRAGVLLGDATLSAEANPFSPQAICDAYQQACHELGTTMKLRGVLMKLFDDHVIDAVRAIYKDLNALFVRNSILPKIRYGVTKKKESAKPKGAAGQEAGAEVLAALSPDAEANLFSLLQGLVAKGGMPALAPGQVPLSGAELLGSHTRIQQGDLGALPPGLPAAAAASGTTNVLHELKASSVGAGMGQMDAMTLDIVAMLFDQLFDDPKIPAGMKGLIGRLQIPMLKVAIADKSFFSKKTHPARQALDAFGEIAVRLPSEFDASSPLYEKLDAIVQRLLDGFQDDVSIFEGVQAEIRTLIDEEDQRVEAETRVVAERAEQAENLAVAKSAAEDEVRARVQAHSLPGPVLEFLVEHWRKLLLLIHAKLGTRSEKWNNALGVMDQLVWSVEPKATVEERRRLAAVVPSLVKHLAAGLQALGTPDEVRSAFFAELMKCHTDILGARAPQAKPASGALDFTAPVTVQNPYGGGEVSVSGLDGAAASKSGAAIDPPEGLEMGTWVEFRLKDGDGGKRAAKLLFVSPKKTRYIFTDRKGRDVLELTRAEVVRRLRSGEAKRLEGEPEEPLFDRIMNGLVSKLKTPAARAA